MMLRQLKQLGHDLLDEYKELTGLGSEGAYNALKDRLKGRQPAHFAQMSSKQEVTFAVGTLKKMIEGIKHGK